MSTSSAELSLPTRVRTLIPHAALTPRRGQYWTDFLVTIVTAHLCTLLTQLLLQLWSGRGGPRLEAVSSALPVGTALADGGRSLLPAVIGGLFLVSVAASFRGLMFLHEVVHRPEPQFRPFRAAWNLLAGIPFLVPSFLYEPHLEHHKSGTYGTEEDGEYLPRQFRSRFGIVLFLLSGLIVPVLLLLRFLVLAPTSWFVPPLRAWTLARASTLVVNPEWERQRVAPEARPRIAVLEAACCLWCLLLIAAPIALQIDPLLYGGHLYTLGAALGTMNALRTLGAHRWRGDGAAFTFEDQTLDSVNVDSPWPWEAILNPVGLRFHALHHLLPGAPYHALPGLHALLKRELPEDSPYRGLSVPSLLAAIIETWRAAGRPPRAMEPTGSPATPPQDRADA